MADCVQTDNLLSSPELHRPKSGFSRTRTTVGVGIPWPGAQSCAIYRTRLYWAVAGQLVGVVGADSSPTYCMYGVVKSTSIKYGGSGIK